MFLRGCDVCVDVCVCVCVRVCVRVRGWVGMWMCVHVNVCTYKCEVCTGRKGM